MTADQILSMTASAMTIASEISKYLHTLRAPPKSSNTDLKSIEPMILSYIQRDYERLSKMTSFAYAGKRELLEMYVSSVLSRGGNGNIEVNNIINFQSINYNKFIIIDSAGMGKSTLSKFIFVRSIDSGEYFPIMAEVRKYDGEMDFERYIFGIVFPALEYDKFIFDSIIKYRRCLIMIDGMDEVPIANKRRAFARIASFVDKTPCKIVITSRPEEMLGVFRELPSYKLCPLTKEKAYELIRKIDNLGEIHKLLIEKLEDGRNRDIAEFLKNPMMVSLLYSSFSYRNDIPVKKQTFYRQVYDALYTMHDLSKGDAYVREKNCKLDIESFHKVCRVLAYFTYRDSQIEFEKDEIIRYLNDVREFIGEFTFSPDDFLRDLYSTVPIFVKEGESYRWSHKSIQEYFASQFISTDSGTQAIHILDSIYKSKNSQSYENLIELLYDTNYRMFEEFYLVRYLLKLKNFVERYLRDNILDGISREEKIRRAALLFLADYAIMPFDFTLVGKERNEDGFPGYVRECFDLAQSVFGVHGRSKSMNLTVDKVNVVANTRSHLWIFELLKRKKSPILREFARGSISFDRTIVKSARLITDDKRIYNTKKYYDKTTQLMANVYGAEFDYEKVIETIERIRSMRTGAAGKLLMA